MGLLRPPLGLWPSYAEMQADYRTATGEQRRYALDSQQLTLALNTQTSLNVATRDGRPEIELVAGEAAIQARRDQPCLVKAGAARLLLADGDIEIRRLRGQQVQLRCNAGQLDVRHPQGALRLAAGMQIAYDDDALDAAPPPARPSDWRARAWSASTTCRWSRRSTRSTATARRVVLMNGDLARRRLSARYEVQDLTRPSPRSSSCTARRCGAWAISSSLAETDGARPGLRMS